MPERPSTTKPMRPADAHGPRSDYSGLSWPKPLAWLPLRLRVLSIGVFLVLSCSLAISVLVMAKTGAPEPIHLWWLIAIGPFAGLYEGQMSSPRAIGIAVGILAPLMLAHSIVPHLSTAIVSLLGFAMWGFMGLAICTSAV